MSQRSPPELRGKDILLVITSARTTKRSAFLGTHFILYAALALVVWSEDRLNNKVQWALRGTSGWEAIYVTCAGLLEAQILCHNGPHDQWRKHGMKAPMMLAVLFRLDGVFHITGLACPRAWRSNWSWTRVDESTYEHSSRRTGTTMRQSSILRVASKNKPSIRLHRGCKTSS